MRRDKNIVLNSRKISNVIGGPHNHVVSDCYIIVESVPLKNKAVFPRLQLVRRENSGTDIAREGVPLFLCLSKLCSPQRVHLLKPKQDEHLALLRRNLFLNSGERNHRASHKLLLIRI